MRIIFATDIHQAFKSVEELLSRTEADLYIIAGDLVYRSFHRYETAWRFMELQQILGGYRQNDGRSKTLLDFSKSVITKEKNGQLVSQASEYIVLCKKADTYLRKMYARLENILSEYPDRSLWVLPGNYDMDLSTTQLKDRNLHLNSFRYQDWKISGYGGAKVATPGIPDHLQVPFKEKEVPGELLSEPFDFFSETKPDILALHEAPYGYLDVIPSYGSTGSHGIRKYIDEAEVKLVLSGHYHENWGALFDAGTLFFNPSNFGKTFEVSRVRDGGYFLDLILDDTRLVSATLRQLSKVKVYSLLYYSLSSKGLETIILDEKRYERLGGKVPKTKHIEPIKQIQRVKSFFLGYETPETLDLIDELRNIYREIREQGMEVAFDLLGSLNFGMAEKNSDMDVVVYMRNRDCVLDDLDTCGIPRPLSAVFNALEERNLNVEVCDSIDLDRVRNAIETNDIEDGQLQRFIFYRAVCRPVNLRIIKRVENLLLEKEGFRSEVEKGLEDYLEILVSSVRHISSFDKYKSRLRERGITLAPDVEDALRNYLRA